MVHIKHICIYLLKNSQYASDTSENEAFFYGSAFARLSVSDLHMLYWTSDWSITIDLGLMNQRSYIRA